MTLKLVPTYAADPLKLIGVGRDIDAPGGALSFYFNRSPSDDEMRFLHECMERSVALIPEDM
jgi:hypothetical protein